MLKKSTLAAAALLCGLSAMASNAVLAESATPAASATNAGTTITHPVLQVDLSLPDGEKWSPATEREKTAYLLGLRDMAAVEYQLLSPKSKQRSAAKKWVEGLHGKKLQEIVEVVDTFYKNNPDKQKQPVFEVVWFELVNKNSPATKPTKAK